MRRINNKTKLSLPSFSSLSLSSFRYLYLCLAKSRSREVESLSLLAPILSCGRSFVRELVFVSLLPTLLLYSCTSLTQCRLSVIFVVLILTPRFALALSLGSPSSESLVCSSTSARQESRATRRGCECKEMRNRIRLKSRISANLDCKQPTIGDRSKAKLISGGKQRVALLPFRSPLLGASQFSSILFSTDYADWPFRTGGRWHEATGRGRQEEEGEATKELGAARRYNFKIHYTSGGNREWSSLNDAPPLDWRPTATAPCSNIQCLKSNVRLSTFKVPKYNI